MKGIEMRTMRILIEKGLKSGQEMDIFNWMKASLDLSDIHTCEKSCNLFATMMTNLFWCGGCHNKITFNKKLDLIDKTTLEMQTMVRKEILDYLARFVNNDNEPVMQKICAQYRFPFFHYLMRKDVDSETFEKAANLIEKYLEIDNGKKNTEGTEKKQKKRRIEDSSAILIKSMRNLYSVDENDQQEGIKGFIKFLFFTQKKSQRSS